MIKLTNVLVEGFRLLENVNITLEERTTVIVGRNNSGKTSFAEVFDRFLGEQAGKFRLEDFSAGALEKFSKARELRKDNNSPDYVLKELPIISLELTFIYDLEHDDFGTLAPFIIDLDSSSTKGIARIEYTPELKNISKLFDISHSEGDGGSEQSFFRHLRDIIPQVYSIRCCAIDPTNRTNQRIFDGSKEFRALIQTGFIRAQRTLDLGKRGDTDVIGKLLTQLFRAADSLERGNDQGIAQKLKGSVTDIERELQKNFDGKLKELLPKLGAFGFPSLNDNELLPQTTIDIESLLTGSTRIFYDGANGVYLPEGYNGLGTRNLIYILIQLEALCKAYYALMIPQPVTHLVFIEEPEAHLHPQMQELFIAQLNKVDKTFKSLSESGSWPVQFIISTHSSHLANAVNFTAIRYFLNKQKKNNDLHYTKVKDFNCKNNGISKEDRKFLQKFMTLTKCDLYFADKAILVEGATERILMPCFVEKIDETLPLSEKLSHQYITTIEVGGAYAHRFYKLIDFLELKTLVITDIDPVKGEKRRKCICAEAETTSNQSIIAWFGDDKGISLKDLLSKKPQDKEQKFRRIAYQIPEENLSCCGGSYEEAFILANRDGVTTTDFFKDAEKKASNEAKKYKKTEKAIEYALEDKKEWKVPRYINEGLVWLSEPLSDDSCDDELGEVSE